MESSAIKTLLIVGGGHASLPVIKMGRKWKEHDISIRLISAKPYLIYSGALPQFMAGFYEWNQTAVDLKNLCERCDVPFTAGRVISVNEKKNTVTTSEGSTISYDYLLLNVGASTRPVIDGENISPVKPMSKLLKLREKLVSGSVRKLLIIGGGAAGSELAMNVSHPEFKHSSDITIIDNNDRLLSSYPAKLSDEVTSILKERGVAVITGEETSTGFTKAFDEVILAAGNQPGSVSINHNFKTGTKGRILTEESLRVRGNPTVFAAGDVADVNGKDYQQIGVHAVKQGIVLRKNIKAAILGRPLTNYKPYFTNPLIISNGPDSAFFIMNRWVLKGRMYAVLKYVLDMRWLDKYTKTPEQRKSDVKLFREGVNRSGKK
ncbi:hypothetical protein DYD21_14930 [Rhodohalobacter sp. SW132]|uniref:NAD(P)/FAD-dependent oxidoreductase n=1 Tax=Rhodohalobacter sp. SW132 TaxID=2293433 RepID=UPI000E23B80B|nr:FAD-dependent oxidoreductase [Rhodohalobacter sp. SW132]REL29146.1 hypothetical protein DYD21_14930 [Rhodohalobacter sp. SW132]